MVLWFMSGTVWFGIFVNIIDTLFELSLQDMVLPPIFCGLLQARHI